MICQNGNREDLTEILFLMYAVLLRVISNLPFEVTSDLLPFDLDMNTRREVIVKKLHNDFKMPVGTD